MPVGFGHDPSPRAERDLADFLVLVEDRAARELPDQAEAVVAALSRALGLPRRAEAAEA
ncbi:hypothetical protein GCM10022221_44670 [Actinocorallia aurea]